MFDGLKRKIAAGAISSLLKSLATSKDTQTSITGIIAGAVLAVPNLDFSKLIAGDPQQIGHVVSGILVALIGILATKKNADGKTTLLGTAAGALYASQGGVDSFVTGGIVAALGYFTNKPVGVSPTVAMKKAAPVLLVLCILGLPLMAADPCSQYDAYWSHIYKPERLAVQAKCVSVTGTIVDAAAGKKKDGVRHEGDGDSHGWLKLDPGQTKYLNAGNKSNEDGNLVFEVQCLFRVTQEDAKAACANWHSPLLIPPVGSHVKITGTWVQDDNHAHWFEIHPVFAFEILK